MGQVSDKNHNMEFQSSIFARPNFALDGLTILCLYVPGFQRQAFKRFKILQARLQEIKEQRESPCCRSTYNAQNAQVGLVMITADYRF